MSFVILYVLREQTEASILAPVVGARCLARWFFPDLISSLRSYSFVGDLLRQNRLKLFLLFGVAAAHCRWSLWDVVEDYHAETLLFFAREPLNH